MIIVITRPELCADEADRIKEMLLSGKADLVHIRKPSSTIVEVEQLLRHLPSELYGRIVLHDHFGLADDYCLRGIHLNSRHPQPPAKWKGAVSISCHSLSELAKCREQAYDYMSLSPIFDSISKPDYHSAFTAEALEEAHRQGLIDHRVMALGGVTFERVPEVLQMGFGGAMILGDAWK